MPFRAHLLFQLWTFSPRIHCKTNKKTKKFAEIFKKNSWIFKFNGNRILLDFFGSIDHS